MTDARSPAISVCIPTYQRAAYLEKALRSVLDQEGADFEVVVFDDASTDGTVAVVRGLADARVRYFRQPRRVGVARNRNSCLDVARGRYVAWLDSDDLYEPDALRALTEVLDGNPDVGLVHGRFSVIDADGRTLPEWPPPFETDVVEPRPAAFCELVLENYIAAPTVMVRRSVHDRAGPYSVELGSSSEDWEMWLRVSLLADLAYVARPIARYRYHQASLSRAAERSGARLTADARVVGRVFTRWPDLVPEPEIHEPRAREALAARALESAGEALARTDRLTARGFAEEIRRQVPTMAASIERLLEAIDSGDEYGAYRVSRELLQELAGRLDGTRFGSRLAAQVRRDPEWERELRTIAGTIRSVVPADARVAVVDKWDPSLRHLSGRAGWTFPDRALLPDGYPADSEAAIAHLRRFRDRGARYLIFSRATAWWLEHYDGLRAHLQTHDRAVWADERCMIYELT